MGWARGPTPRAHEVGSGGKTHLTRLRRGWSWGQEPPGLAAYPWGNSKEGDRDEARRGLTSANWADGCSQQLSGPALGPHAFAHAASPHPLGLPSSFCSAQLSPLCDTFPKARDQGGTLALTFLRGWTVNRGHGLAPGTHITLKPALRREAGPPPDHLGPECHACDRRGRDSAVQRSIYVKCWIQRSEK